jgi:hypothetical protein
MDRKNKPSGGKFFLDSTTDDHGDITYLQMAPSSTICGLTNKS